MATNETYIPGQLYLINLNELLPDPDQPRKYIRYNRAKDQRPGRHEFDE